jgi:hypothetical protein
MSNKRRYNAIGANVNTSDLERRLNLNRLAKTGPHGPMNVGGQGTQEGWQVEDLRSVNAVKRNMMLRWQQEFMKGATEGLAGKNQKTLVSTSGPRRSIDSITRPVRYRGGGQTYGKRVNRTRRLVNAGRATEAMSRILRTRSRCKERFLRQDARKLKAGCNVITVQTGLHYRSKESAKKCKKRRVLDLVM